MAKPAKIFLVFLLLIAIVVLGFLLGKKLYDRWGRTMVYPKDSTVSQYPGIGKIAQFFEERILVVPRFAGRPYSDEGRPFFDEPENLYKYPEDRYEVFAIPTQEQIIYSVGTFEGWEKIEGSLDKYVIIRYPDSQETEKFRVGFESSDLYKDNITTLWVESVGVAFTKIKNPINTYFPSTFQEITYPKIETLFKRGDAVVVVPLFEAPEVNKKDKNGNYLASSLIIRRIGGKI